MAKRRRKRRVLPVRPRRTDEKAFEKSLKKTLLDPMFVRMRRGLALAAGSAEVLRQLEEEQYVPKDWGLPTKEVHEAMDRVKNYHAKKLVSTFRSALGIDIRSVLTEPSIEAFMHTRINASVDLIKTIPTRAHVRLKARLKEELKHRPFDRKSLSQMLNKEYNSSGYNLRRLTRDQTNKAVGGLTEIRHGQLGLQKYVWRNVSDEKVRESHREYGGQTFDWNKPPEEGNPGWPIQCFAGSTRILPAGLQCSVAYRYVGEIVKLTLANGIDITITPNHPILTQSGWKSASLIDEGDEVLVHRGAGDFVSCGSDPKINDMYPFAKHLHGFLGGSPSICGAVGRSVDLYGDPASRDEEVDVVAVERPLRDKLQFRAAQGFSNLGFELPDMNEISGFLPLKSEGIRATGHPPISGGGVGGRRETFFFIEGKAAHSDKVSLGTGSGGDAICGEDSANDRSADIVSLGHLNDRQSGVEIGKNIVGDFGSSAGVSLVARMGTLKPKFTQAGSDGFLPHAQGLGDLRDELSVSVKPLDLIVKFFPAFAPVRVSSVYRDWHDDLVYSFESDSGALIANGIVVGNCRCAAEPIIPDDFFDEFEPGPEPQPLPDPLPKPAPKLSPKPVSVPKPVSTPETLDDYIKAGDKVLAEIDDKKTIMKGVQTRVEWERNFRSELRRRLKVERGAGKLEARFSVRQGGGAAAKRLEKATRDLPEEWVKTGNRWPPATAKGVKRGYYRWPKNAGYYGEQKGEIRLSKHAGVEIHEYMHHLQAMDPDIDRLFQELHKRRTAGEALVDIGGGEMARTDKYLWDYQGREYDKLGAVEGLPMAIQTIFSEVDAKSHLRRFHYRDPEMLKLVLGLLFRHNPKP